MTKIYPPGGVDAAIHEHLKQALSDLLLDVNVQPIWTEVQNHAARVRDASLSLADRRSSIRSAVASLPHVGNERLALALEHHLLIELGDTVGCPVVEDRLARVMLLRDGIDVIPFTVGGRILARDLGMLPADATKRSAEGKFSLSRGLEDGPVERWLTGMQAAEQLIAPGDGSLDAEQAGAALTCMAMLILNLHCMEDRHQAARVTYQLWSFWPQLSKRLKRQLTRSRSNSSLRLVYRHFLDDDCLHQALEFKLQSEMQRLRSPAVAFGSAEDGTASPREARPWSVRVLKEAIPPSAYREDRDQLTLYEPLREPLPVRTLDGPEDLGRRLDVLAREFPWALDALETVRNSLEAPLLLGHRPIKLPHLLLAGRPGSGKSRLARRLAEVFGLPFTPISVGGSTDTKMLVGTSRGWASAAPSPLLASILRSRCASGLVLLDELDKGAASENGGRIINALLTLLEPETAASYLDGFLQVRCDLSWLSFVGTVNSLRLPDALLSRFKIVYVPEPSEEHRPAMAKAMVAELANRWGVPFDALPALPSTLVADAGRSARDLQRRVEDYLAVWARATLKPQALH